MQNLEKLNLVELTMASLDPETIRGLAMDSLRRMFSATARTFCEENPDVQACELVHKAQSLMGASAAHQFSGEIYREYGIDARTRRAVTRKRGDGILSFMTLDVKLPKIKGTSRDWRVAEDDKI